MFRSGLWVPSSVGHSEILSDAYGATLSRISLLANGQEYSERVIGFIAVILQKEKNGKTSLRHLTPN